MRALFPLVTASLVCWYVSSSLWVYPHSLSYFNESIGGPRNGAEHLLGSNVDWGQDLRYLKWWLEDHPEAQPLYVAHVGFFNLNHLGIECSRAEDIPNKIRDALSKDSTKLKVKPGWYAMSVNGLQGYPLFVSGIQGGKKEKAPGFDSLSGLRELTPVDKLSYSFYFTSRLVR